MTEDAGRGEKSFSGRANSGDRHVNRHAAWGMSVEQRKGIQNMGFYFNDKEGREIKIVVSENCAYAYHDGQKIGDLITTGLREIDEYSPDMPAKITGWEVDKEYRRAGIATAMVQQLVAEIGILLPGQRDRGIGGENALTDDGLGITKSCQKLGLVYPFPDDVEPSSE